MPHMEMEPRPSVGKSSLTINLKLVKPTNVNTPLKISNIAGVVEPWAIPGSGRDLLREPVFLAQVYSVSSVVVSAQSRSPEVSMQVQVGWEASLWPILPKVSSAWGFLFWVFPFLGQKLCVSHLVLPTIFRGGECTTPAVM